ncbi:hypothetical protein [Chryseobacterium mulctrae]|uniref:hypothetical protein n=1 Tax=Chryseobacterium mulctrae TaxID=2576777 RepID=UPI00139059FF|nr:hypothetical protein [Chryseobacterium mulctrae]
MKDLSKVDLVELKRRYDVVEWQISIAKELPTLRNREQRLTELQTEILKRQKLL